jgi:hypothetical protein
MSRIALGVLLEQGEDGVGVGHVIWLLVWYGREPSSPRHRQLLAGERELEHLATGTDVGS